MTPFQISWIWLVTSLCCSIDKKRHTWWNTWKWRKEKKNEQTTTTFSLLVCASNTILVSNSAMFVHIVRHPVKWWSVSDFLNHHINSTIYLSFVFTLDIYDIHWRQLISDVLPFLPFLSFLCTLYSMSRNFAICI